MRLPHPVFGEAAEVLEMISRTPEDRALYEARLKLQRDEQSRLEAAEARGVARGVLIGKIQTLQSVLNEREQPSEELSKLNDDELNALLVSLQKRLSFRD
jgi:hypothetical protein